MSEREREREREREKINFESSVEESQRRKEAKYEEFVEAGWVAGYKVKLITLEVGSRGDGDRQLHRNHQGYFPCFAKGPKSTVL